MLQERKLIRENMSCWFRYPSCEKRKHFLLWSIYCKLLIKSENFVRTFHLLWLLLTSRNHTPLRVDCQGSSYKWLSLQSGCSERIPLYESLSLQGQFVSWWHFRWCISSDLLFLLGDRCNAPKDIRAKVNQMFDIGDNSQYLPCGLPWVF